MFTTEYSGRVRTVRPNSVLLGRAEYSWMSSKFGIHTQTETDRHHNNSRVFTSIVVTEYSVCLLLLTV